MNVTGNVTPFGTVIDLIRININLVLITYARVGIALSHREWQSIRSMLQHYRN